MYLNTLSNLTYVELNLSAKISARTPIATETSAVPISIKQLELEISFYFVTNACCVIYASVILYQINAIIQINIIK